MAYKNWTFTDALLFIAKQEADSKCCETTNNKATCLEPIFDYSKLNFGQSYCAGTVRYWVHLTCNFFDVENVIPFNTSFNSTHYIYNYFKDGKKGVTVNTTPKPGCIFFYSTGKTTGHVGIVAKVDNDYIYTYEGNTTCKSTCNGEGLCSKKRKITSNDFKFIHIEDYEKYKKLTRFDDLEGFLKTGKKTINTNTNTNNQNTDIINNINFDILTKIKNNKKWLLLLGIPVGLYFLLRS